MYGLSFVGAAGNVIFEVRKKKERLKRPLFLFIKALAESIAEITGLRTGKTGPIGAKSALCLVNEKSDFR